MCLIKHLVKQAIAWQRFIPFYKFFGRQDPQFDSPGGALVLHWLFTVLWICLDNSSSDSYAFIIGIFEYGYELMMGKFFRNNDEVLEVEP